MARGRIRKTISFVIMTTCVVLVAEIWICAGLVVPLHLSGPSMAPRLMGEHLSFRCECGKTFRVLLPRSSPVLSVICPGCGQKLPVASGIRLRADRVLVLRPGPWNAFPKRWQVVCFRSWERPQELLIKRAVGLPGDSVSFESERLRIGFAGGQRLDEALRRLSMPLGRIDIGRGTVAQGHGRPAVAGGFSADGIPRAGRDRKAPTRDEEARCCGNRVCGSGEGSWPGSPDAPFLQLCHTSLAPAQTGTGLEVRGFLRLGGLPENQLYVLPQDSAFQLGGVLVRVNLRCESALKELGVVFRLGREQASLNGTAQNGYLRAKWLVDEPHTPSQSAQGPWDEFARKDSPEDRTLTFPQQQKFDITLGFLSSKVFFAVGNEFQWLPKPLGLAWDFSPEGRIPICVLLDISPWRIQSAAIELRAIHQCIDCLSAESVRTQVLEGLVEQAPNSSEDLLPAGGPLPRFLGPSELFLSGDNWPLSSDSRHFGPVRVDDSWIGTAALKLRWCACRLGPLEFEVPLPMPVDYIW